MPRTLCANGHPFTDENAMIWNGRRQCRLCHREASRKYAAAKRAITAKPKKTDADRFWAMVKKGVGPKDCWIWQGAADAPPDDYGKFTAKVDGKWKTVRAHRWSYEQSVGPIPAGFQLDHKECQTKRCVNPSHVTPMTPTEHAYRPDSGAGMRLAQTHCKAGHPFDKANTYVRPNGSRMCRECARVAKREAYQSLDFEERTDRQRAYRYSR